MDIAASDFEYLIKFVRDHTAIVLEDRQKYLVESRLMPVARAEGIDSIAALVKKIQSAPQNGLHKKVLDAMTTNETSFLRDLQPFEVLKKNVLPELIEKRSPQKELSIWSAACSSGQEPYSIAMILKENFPQLAGWKVRFMASDFSNEMLRRAKEGAFNQFEMNRGLPAPLLVKYFEKWGVEWKVKEDIKKMVEFFQINLATPWPSLPLFDVVFLRNVMIYFDVPTKKEILGRVRQVLRPDGFLFLGGAESTFNLDDAYERCAYDKGGCYRLAPPKGGIACNLPNMKSAA